VKARIRPVVRWPGGKSRLLAKILPLIPPHECYCEPFAGGLAVLLAKERSDVEVVNDSNSDLINLYRSLQFHLPEFLRQVDFLQSSRRNLKDFIAQPGLTDIQRAARYFVRNRTSFGSDNRSFAISKREGHGASFYRSKATAILGQAHDRLDGVILENLPYERCFVNYDAPSTFFFLDPPYVDTDSGAYEGWKQEDAVKLRRRLHKLKGQWLLTINDSPENRDLFDDCEIEAVTTNNQRVNNRRIVRRSGELIITPKHQGKALR
jgi:DNA adenine methylase